MVTRADDDGVLRTEPVETHVDENGNSHSLPLDVRAGTAEEDDPWAGWNNWLQYHLDGVREEMTDGIVGALTEVRKEWRDKFQAQSEKIKELEIKLAQAVGAIDVLRGRGLPGVFRARGTHDAGTTYAYGDVVAFNGSSWLAVEDNPGDLPGRGWQLVASCGSRGSRGPRGERGAAAPGLSSISFDSENWTVTTRLSDGSLGPVFPLCLLGEVSLDRANYAVCFRALDGSKFEFSLRGLFEQFYSEVHGG